MKEHRPEDTTKPKHAKFIPCGRQEPAPGGDPTKLGLACSWGGGECRDRMWVYWAHSL